MIPGKYASYCNAPAGYTYSPLGDEWTTQRTAECRNQGLREAAAIAAVALLPGWWKLLAIPLWTAGKGVFSSDPCYELALEREQIGMSAKGLWRC